LPGCDRAGDGGGSVSDFWSAAVPTLTCCKGSGAARDPGSAGAEEPGDLGPNAVTDAMAFAIFSSRVAMLQACQGYGCSASVARRGTAALLTAGCPGGRQFLLERVNGGEPHHPAPPASVPPDACPRGVT
jgi:hypothetical protein